MSGSMMVRPGYYPVDIYEFTPGTKVRQTYDLNGAVCLDLSPSWRVAGQINYTAANLAKRKDLRHTTYMMDLGVIPGIQYHRGRFALALNYIFARNAETIRAEQVGTKVASYEAFLDKGLYYGAGQLWTGSGVHLNEAGVDGFPLSEQLQGGSLQLWQGDFYFGARARSRRGQAGEKQRVWYRFGGWDLDVDTDYHLDTPAGTHRLHGSLDFGRTDNDEMALEQKTEGGVTTTVTIGQNRVFTRSTFSGALFYGFTSPGWGISFMASLTDREGLSSVMYPFLFSERMLIPAVGLSGSVEAGHWDFRLDLGWTAGRLHEDTRSVPHQIEVTSTPTRLDSYYDWYREFQTCHKIKVNPGVCRHFGKSLYVDASLWWNHGFGLQTLGTDRLTVTMKIGYNF